MCGRYYRRSDKQRIADAFKLGKLPNDLTLPPDFNVAPTTFQPVIRSNKETGERELEMMRWGLVPYFAKSPADFKGFSTINAKAETVATAPTWRRPFEKRRCLVPADGFYEWKKLTEKTKQPYGFAMKNSEPFAFAGLWDAWKEPDGKWLISYSIITTDANEVMQPVHNRMPVILHQRDYDRWLSRDETERPPVDLLRPYDADLMEAHPVDPRVGNVRNNEPGLCDFWCRAELGVRSYNNATYTPTQSPIPWKGRAMRRRCFCLKFQPSVWNKVCGLERSDVGMDGIQWKIRGLRTLVYSGD